MNLLYSQKKIDLFWLSMLFSMIILSNVLIPAFAQEQVGNDLDNLIEGGVNQVTDKLTDNIDLSNGNPLNVTKEETEDVVESGKGLFFAVMDLFKATHEFASSMINLISPYPVQSLILILVAGAITVITALSLLKRLAIHVLIFIVVALVAVAIFALFYF